VWDYSPFETLPIIFPKTITAIYEPSQQVGVIVEEGIGGITLIIPCMSKKGR
jgi:hypothetical protein